MSKKLILFLMVLLLGSTSFLRADELTVHDGTGTSSYVPVYGFYADAYLKCEMVFPAAELTDMENGTINGMTFYATSPAAEAWTATWQVFVAEVANATISDFAGPGTVVYEGTLDGTQSSMTITFSAPYTYNGGNLLVGVYCTETGNYKSVTWGGETVEGASVQGYSYSSLSAVSASQRNFLPKTTFAYTPGSQPTPPTPTGDLVITPNPFELGERALNGWMEPYAVRINNGGEDVTITASLSNTAGVNAFSMSEEINNVTLATGEELSFVIDINTNAAAGDYTEEFTMFSVTNGRDITTIPVTSTFYTAGEADIVETAKTLELSYTSGVANFSHTPADLHANYLLAGMTEMTTDAVYKVTIAKDAVVNVNNNVKFYTYVAGFQPTAAIEPEFAAAANEDVTVLAGTYYMIVTDYVDGDVEGTVEQIPAPTALTALAPEDGATEVEAPVTLTWEGGENATQYQVLFGTSPVNMDVVLDWTMIDANYGSYTVANVMSNTQYFWQIKAKNSNGTVQTVRRGFTTTLTAPNTVTASEEEIFVDGSTLIKWKHSTGAMGDIPETQIGSGTSTSAYLPTYNLYNYSLSEQIYTGEEIGEAGYINSISFHPAGTITRNLKIYMANTDKTSFASGSDWVAMEADNLVYEGDVAMVANTWVTVTLNEPFEFDGSNLLLAVTDHTGTWTSSIQYSTFDATAQAINVYQDSAPYNATAPAGSGTVRAFKNQIIINKDGAKGNTATRGFLGYNVYYGDVKANTSLLTEKQYLLSNLPYNMEGHDINVTAVYDEGESGHSTPIVTVKVSGYATLTGTVSSLATTQAASTPVAGATVTFSGKDEFNNDVTFEGTTNANGVYTIAVKAGTYNRGVATLEGMEPAYMEETSVVVAYEGTETVNFTIHEEYKPVLSVYAEEIDPSMSKVTWSLNTAISGGGTGGNGSTFTEGFEGGMPAGWTVVDGNNDGYTWCLTSAIPTTWTYYASLTLDWYRTGTNAICSGSYINGAGALTPNEYLIMGQQMLVNGSTLSFWAAATDASYPADHFGVCVSDDATNWTMVNEWTLTAKEGANGGRESREGNGAKLGTWHNFSVDLSAYAGQKYIAIRHFNCTDQYIMCVDDIELSTGSKDRSLDHYAVYRKAILKENAIVPADSVQLVENYSDTLYADFAWNNMVPGLYQYGVQAVYPTPLTKGGNRDEIAIGNGTVSSYQVPFNSLYGYSFTEQVYLASEIGMAGNINSISFQISQAYTAAQTNHYTVWMKNVARETFASNTDYEPVSTADVVFEGDWEIPVCAQGDWITLTLDTPFAYDGTSNLMFAMHESTSGYSTRYFYCTAVTSSGISYYSDSNNPDPYNLGSYSGSKVVRSNRNNVILDITAGGGGGNDDPETPITWSNILPKNMETTVELNALVAAGNAAGATYYMTNEFENLVVEGEFDETGTVTLPAFRKGNWVVTIDLEGYTSDIVEEEIAIWNDTLNVIDATLTEICKPVDGVSVSVTGFATWTAVVPVDRMPEKYFVTLNGVFYGETTDNFMQINEDILEEGETYTFGVAVVYSTGMSAYVTTNFTYEGCAGVATQVEDLAVDSAYCQEHPFNVALVWNGGTPTPTPPTPPTPPTGNDFNFDDGTFMGWTTIDANNDGYNWVMGSQIGGVYLVSGASLAGSGHNSSADLVCSGSYSNATNQAITPDNYLVSPAKAEYTGISFWACGQDASYVAEHFGVAVSTNGNTSASDFTIVAEWTMTAKGDGAMSIGRDGQTRAQGNWYQKTVDLSAYAGQQIWVAIRHFNCNDMFILDVDDITLGTPQKSATAETCGVTYPSINTRAQWDLLKDFNGTSGYQYGVATDGNFIYTSSWSASSTSMFYKYDMDGNFVEEFNVSGCGQIRDLTYDGQYFYGVANSSVIYCIDLANHTLVSQTTSAYGAMRCCAYDSQRDGFWVVGNWSGNLTLVDRTGAIQITGPAPTSASGVAYYKDNDGVEHVLCFNNGTNDVEDYNITTNVMGGSVFNFNNAPGTGSGSSGGCHIANYGDKLAFYGDIQASPQYIAIYELGEAQGGGGGGQIVSDLTPNKFNIKVDGVIVAATSDNSYIYEVEEGDYSEHEYTVFFVDAQYGVSCEQTVVYAVEPLSVEENMIVNAIYPNPTSGDLHINAEAMTHINIVNTMGQVVYSQDVNADETVIDMAKFESGVYMVSIITENGTSVKRVTVTK